MFQTETLVEILLASLEKNKAQDISILDIKHLTDIADSLIICTATSSRHALTLKTALLDTAQAHPFSVLGVEGEKQGEWIIVDFGVILAHIMQIQTREFYQLEKLWGTPMTYENQTYLRR